MQGWTLSGCKLISISQLTDSTVDAHTEWASRNDERGSHHENVHMRSYAYTQCANRGRACTMMVAYVIWQCVRS